MVKSLDILFLKIEHVIDLSTSASLLLLLAVSNHSVSVPYTLHEYCY